jgi:putative ABC transport system ATP-binding protein
MSALLDEQAALIDILHAASAQVRHPVSLDAIKRVVRRAEPSPFDTPGAPRAELLSRCARACGLRVQELRLPQAALPAALAAGLPAWVEGPAAGLLLTGLLGGDLLIYAPGRAPERLRPAALPARLGVGKDDDLQVILIDPGLPASVLDPLGPQPPQADGPADHDAAARHATPFSRIAALVRAERQDIVVVIIYSLAVGIFALATPLVVQVLINTVAFTALGQPILALSVVLLACVGAAGALRVLQRIVVEVLQRRLFVRMVADLAARLPRVSQRASDQGFGPELVNRFFDVLTVQKSVKHLLIDGVSAVLQAAVGLILLAFYHPALLAFSVLMMTAVVAILAPFSAGAQKTAKEESKGKYAVAGWLEELARSPLAFRSPAGLNLAMDRADTLSRRYLEQRAAHFHYFLRQYGGIIALQAIAGAGLLAVGGWLVIERQLSLGQLVASEFIVASVLTALTKTSEKLEVWYDLGAAVDKLGHLLELPMERSDGVPSTLPADRPAALRLSGVSFQYDCAEGGVCDVDLDLAPGERVLISGATGSGKSSLAGLIYGLRSPERGAVELDHHDLRDLPLAELRRHVSLVGGVEVIVGSIAENVQLGDATSSRVDLREVLDTVGLLGAVARLPQAAETQLSPTGAPFSSGQQRQLMVARALAARPRLIIVDDVLDGLGRATQAQLVSALCPPSRPWTLVVLSRDPGLSGDFDRRLELEGGRLSPAAPAVEAA